MLLPSLALSQPVELSVQARAQIGALIAEKEARRPAERKVDSQLLYAGRMARGAAIAPGLASIRTTVEYDGDGLAVVEIRALPSPTVLAAIVQVGGKVERSNVEAATIDALVPLAAVTALAERPDVMFVAPRAEAMTQRAGVTWTTADARRAAARPSTQGFGGGTAGMQAGRLSPRLQRFKDTVAHALTVHAAKIGSVTAEGDRTHRTDDLRNALGLDGSGLRIGILSDSFNSNGGAASDIAAGDLPGPGNPNGYLAPVTLVGSGDSSVRLSDEGRAMAQIVHDMAPGALLYFATAVNSLADFANNIRALRGIAASAPPFGNLTPGADIIIDDILYFVETGLHDGQPGPSSHNMAIVNQAVNDVVADGAMLFSSAGNSGNLAQNTSGTWEGDFTPGGSLATIPGGGDVHVWEGNDVGNTITRVGLPVITMQWSDPIGASTNDYDLFRLDSSLTTVLAASTNAQTGTQDPFERVGTDGNTRLVVVRRAGAAPRFISLTTHRGQLQYATDGQIRGHSGVAAAYSIAATPAAAALGAPPNPVGPFPNPHNVGNVTELFSSDGPRRVFFNADGTPITPGNLLAGTGGGLVRSKPDFTAADGVMTTLPAGGLNPFFGTSAAAPAAGAIFALLRQTAPSAAPEQLRGFVASTALDIMAPGVDAVAGGGIVQAFQAAQAAGAQPGPRLLFDTPTLSGDNNRLDPNDCNQLSILLRNIGPADATSVIATLSSSTPGVLITQATSAYPTLAAQAGTGNNITPFQISTDGSIAQNSRADFTLSVRHAGGRVHATFPFSMPVGVDASNYRFTVAPVPALIPAGGTLVPGTNANDALGTSTAPFDLRMFGDNFPSGTVFTVSTNGFLGFEVPSAGSGSGPINFSLPVGPTPPYIVPYWDDLDLNVPGGGVYTQTSGTAPNRRFIVAWRGRHADDGTANQNLSFAVMFDEGASLATSPFRLVYALTGTGPSANGASATVGVQKGDASGVFFTQYVYEQPLITAGLVLDAERPVAVSNAGSCAVPGGDVLIAGGALGSPLAQGAVDVEGDGTSDLTFTSLGADSNSLDAINGFGLVGNVGGSPGSGAAWVRANDVRMTVDGVGRSEAIVAARGAVWPSDDNWSKVRLSSGSGWVQWRIGATRNIVTPVAFVRERAGRDLSAAQARDLVYGLGAVRVGGALGSTLAPGAVDVEGDGTADLTFVTSGANSNFLDARSGFGLVGNIGGAPGTGVAWVRATDARVAVDGVGRNEIIADFRGASWPSDDNWSKVRLTSGSGWVQWRFGATRNIVTPLVFVREGPLRDTSAVDAQRAAAAVFTDSFE